MSKRKSRAKARKPVAKAATEQTPKQMVGRGTPPNRSQFSKGQRGNPKGRPKGSRNVRSIIMEAARHPVTATIDGKQRRISKVQATAMQLATRAAGGDPRAVSQLLDWVDEIEIRAAAARPAQFPFEQADLEVLKAVHDRMKLLDLSQPRD